MDCGWRMTEEEETPLQKSPVRPTAVPHPPSCGATAPKDLPVFSDLTRTRFRRFRSMRRAWWSLLLLAGAFGLSLFSELLSNDKPLLLGYKGELHAPVFKFYPGTRFGLEQGTSVDYRALKTDPGFEAAGGWMLFPP